MIELILGIIAMLIILIIQLRLLFKDFYVCKWQYYRRNNSNRDIELEIMETEAKMLYTKEDLKYLKNKLNNLKKQRQKCK